MILEQNQIYPAMSGHNTICTATALLETGMIPMTEPTTAFTLEAPAGPIEIEAACSGGKATEITLKNQPAFVGHLGVTVDVPSFGKVPVDIAYGGMWYCIVEAAAMGLELTPARGKDICRLGEMVKFQPDRRLQFAFGAQNVRAARGYPFTKVFIDAFLFITSRTL